jgi:uncharacterized lipoprotein YmbA
MPKFIVLCSLIFLSGCITPPPGPKSRYYQLQPSAAPALAALDPASYVIVGPVEVSPYLNRPQIVERRGPNELAYREFDRWAEALDKGVSAVIATNMTRLLDTNRVLAFSNSSGRERGYSIQLRVDRFEASPGGEAVLSATWRVLGAGKEVEPILNRTVLNGKAEQDTMASAVAAQSKLLSDLSRLIAADLLKIAKP